MTSLGLLVALIVVLGLWNNVTNLVGIPEPAYVPLNVVALLALLALARGVGLTWDELGFARAGVPAGLRLGGALAAVIALGLAVIVAVPALHPLLSDARAAGLSTGELAFRVGVRIPIGTALFEEVAFRGVLLALWARHGSLTAAVVGSSVLFGLWHIGPTMVTLGLNGVSAASPGGVGAIVGAVLVTGLAGVGFCWLRLHTGSIIAPVLVHAALNGFATLAAHVVQR